MMKQFNDDVLGGSNKDGKIRMSPGVGESGMLGEPKNFEMKQGVRSIESLGDGERQPQLNDTCYVAKSASVTGNVSFGDNVGIWDNAAVRGDIASIYIGNNSNVQDNAVIHVGVNATVNIGDGTTVGHGAIVHGCTVGNNTIVGMGAIILDDASIGSNCIIGAGALVTSGTVIPDGKMAFGNPAKVIRDLTPEEIEYNKLNAAEYVHLIAQKKKPITIQALVKNHEVNVLIKCAEKHLNANGYTEHSYRHVGLSAKNAANILRALQKPQRQIELAEIAGFLHDIGNAINRVDHAHSGALMAYRILREAGMSCDEAAEVMLAISNHDEGSGVPVSDISAALILADKSDVHRSRVKNKDRSTFDIHDRVNYAVIKSEITVEPEHSAAVLKLDIDIEICPVMDYFEIFLTRMAMNRKAAEYLGLKFELIINNSKLL